MILLKFAFHHAVKNMKRKPLRYALLTALVMLIAFTVFSGAFVIISLQRGLAVYRARLGADMVVVPSSAAGHGSVDDILLQGITGNYYMSGKVCEKVAATDGIEAVTKQFFLTSAKASCCSSRVQIIGFDPDTDFSIMPWIAESYSGTVQDGDVVVGAKIGVPESGRITFYGQEYTIAARLKETGTGLDSAVFANMNTVRKMAVNASSLLKTSPFQGIDIDTAASALLIKVADGYSVEQVTDDINIHITKVKATPAKSMISDLSEGLTGTSALIGIMAAVIWAMAVIILVIVFVLLSNERRKEFAVLRIMGASRKMLSRIMGTEAAVLGAIGAIIGIVLSVLAIFPLSGSIRDMLKLPFFMPDLWVVLVLAAGAFLIALSAALLTALLSAKKITKNETALLLREDT